MVTFLISFRSFLCSRLQYEVSFDKLLPLVYQCSRNSIVAGESRYFKQRTSKRINWTISFCVPLNQPSSKLRFQWYGIRLASLVLMNFPMWTVFYCFIPKLTIFLIFFFTQQWPSKLVSLIALKKHKRASKYQTFLELTKTRFSRKTEFLRSETLRSSCWKGSSWRTLKV